MNTTLQDAVSEAFDRLDRATRTVADIVAEYEPQWPRAPKDIFYLSGDHGGDIERCLTGRGYPDGMYYARIPPLEWFGKKHAEAKAELVAFETKPAPRRGLKAARERLAELQADREMATAYWGEVERIKAASGYDAADAAASAARNALKRILIQIMATPAADTEGLSLQVSAMARVSDLTDRQMLFMAMDESLTPLRWGSVLAASVQAVGAS